MLLSLASSSLTLTGHLDCPIDDKLSGHILGTMTCPLLQMVLFCAELIVASQINESEHVTM